MYVWVFPVWLVGNFAILCIIFSVEVELYVSIILELVYTACVIGFFFVKVPRMERKSIEEKRNREKEREAFEKDVAYTEGLEKIVKRWPRETQEYMKKLKDLETAASLPKNASILYERKGDWAVAGGIAQGIAGPAAGAVVAQNIIRENQAIDQRNENITKGLAYYQMHSAPKIEERIKYLKGHAPNEITVEELKERHRIILAWSPKTLFEKLYFPLKKCIRDEVTGSIVVSVTCRVQQSVKIKIDGSLRAKLYTPDGKYVGCAYLSLPYYFSSGDTLSGIITQSNMHDTSYLREANEYKIEIDYVDLWELAPKNARFSTKEQGYKLTAKEHRQIVAEHEAEFKKEENKAFGR